MLQQQSNDSMDYTILNNNNSITQLTNAEYVAVQPTPPAVNVTPSTSSAFTGTALTPKYLQMPSLTPTSTANTTPPGGSVAPLQMPALTPIMPHRLLENFMIYENFDVHETHRIEDGICTQLTRLPTKKQEQFKQFGIQTNNQSVTYYEKYLIVENFIKFCNEYQVSDHRPFLDFNESGLPKCEQLKFVRYLGQGLPNLTLNKVYLAFKDVLGLNRIEKITVDGYNLDNILKKKKKTLFNRMHATGTATYVF